MNFSKNLMVIFQLFFSVIKESKNYEDGGVNAWSNSTKTAPGLVSGLPGPHH